ncbi:hypothetical protein H5410_030768 [Solanum commersonii]|uniref:Uncharacterized protein n=1 Tax=Solanum commersonii TaxID=4109 RepID=A0A9J5YKB8_SOLCO|nr:hypothetical protein H5410_030768 [Solanum commersonii]
MSAKEEVGESRTLVVYNGSASRINEIGLQLYPISKYLYLPKYFHAWKYGKKKKIKLGDSFEAIAKLKRLASTRTLVNRMKRFIRLFASIF